MRRSIGVVTHIGLPVIDGKFFIYDYGLANKNIFYNYIYFI